MLLNLSSAFFVASFLGATCVQGVALRPRNPPAQPQNVKKIQTPSGATIRYKEPGKDGICETTPGVGSYSGYIDLADDIHVFFYLFESRHDPHNDPVTLWLNGGPGSDSLIGAFEEIGPCYVNEKNETALRNTTWSNASNLLFLSQPVGTGFSYSQEAVGYLDPTYLTVEPPKAGQESGRWSVIDATKNDTASLAAVVAWELTQAFYSGLAQLDPKISSTKFSLWAESFGGHWGPAFAAYFNEQNKKVDQQKITGRKLDFKSFGIVNGIIDEQIQEKHLLEFTQDNTFGLKLINETIYDHGKFNMYGEGGCQDLQDYCATLDRTTLAGKSACSSAQFVCQNRVEDLYYTYGGGRGAYHVLKCNGDDVPPSFWHNYLNTAKVQSALGVDLNYTTSNNIYNAFSLSGDFANGYLAELEQLLDQDIQVALVYGDADFICNWQGGEDVSKSARWSGRTAFNKAGYTDLVVGGKSYGETRQYGRFSFTRVWDSGHEVPYWQPGAAFAIFNRTLHGMDAATGKVVTTGNSTYSTKGTPNTTHSYQAPKNLSCSTNPS